MEKTNTAKSAAAAEPKSGGAGVLSSIEKAFAFVAEHGKQITLALNVAQGLATTLKVVQTLRGAGPLLRIGGRRGPGLLGTMAMIGGGAAIGAGVGILFAPASGGKTRRKWARRLEELTGDLELEADEPETPRERRVKAAPKEQTRSLKNGVSHAHGSA